MGDYADDIQTAIEMIEEFGGSFTITRKTPNTDPAQPWKLSAAAVPPTFTVPAVMLEFKKSQQSQGFTAGSEDSRIALPGDMLVLIAAGHPDITFRPMARDLVTAPGGHGVYGVVDNQILAPDGTDILYKLWVRR